MDFRIFVEFEIRRGGDQPTAFREGFELVVVAELNAGGLIPAEQVKRRLAILTPQLMPAFK